MPYKILIVDDHALVREGLAALVSALPGGATVHMAGTAAQALEQAELYTPFDAVLLDCGLPDADGGSLIQALSQRTGKAPIVVVSGIESAESIDRMLQLGAAAFVSKTKAGSALIAALKRALTHGTALPPTQVPPQPDPSRDGWGDNAISSLTARQLDVLLMLDQGLTNRDISLQLGLSEKTVKNHVFSLCAALGVTSRLHAVRKARDSGLLKN